jgi:putative zinc finger/helix-turn-helix YgiT family protein
MACGEVAVEERAGPFTVEHNGKTAIIQDRRMVCASCGNVSYQGTQISEHELAVGTAIRQMEGLLSPQELSRVRLKYRFKQTDMEQMLSTGPKTWTRWERGKVPQSKAADKLIRVIAEDPTVARRLMEQAGVVNEAALEVFEQIESDAKKLARVMLRQETMGWANRDVEHIIDRAFEAVSAARHTAASQAEAA